MLASRAIFFMSFSATDKALLNAAKDKTDNTTQALQKALANGANINVADIRPANEFNWIGYKYTPLMWAVHNGQMEKVKFLIDNGADATLQTGRGNTLLHIAAREGHAALYHFLAYRFPDQLSIEGEDGLTPDKIATKYNYSEIASEEHSESLKELSDLPDELWLFILSYVDARTLLCVSMVSNRFANIANDDGLWMPIAKNAPPALKIKEYDSGLSIKDQLRQKVIAERRKKMTTFIAQEKTKKPRREFETIDSPLSIQTTNAGNNVKSGALWTLPIFTYGAGKMIAADDRGGYMSGLENALGILMFPWAVIGDLAKAPIMATYTAANALRFAVVAPVNLFFGGRDTSKEEENLYQTMRYSMYAAIDGLKRLKLENDDSLAAMSKEGHLQPLMAMVCFLMAYNSLATDKNTLLLNETTLTKKTCPPKFLPFFERIIQIRDTMRSNLNLGSTNLIAEQAIEWVPQIWAALKSDKDYSVDNELVQKFILQLKDLVAMLMKSEVGKTTSERMTRRLGS